MVKRFPKKGAKNHRYEPMVKYLNYRILFIGRVKIFNTILNLNLLVLISRPPFYNIQQYDCN